MTLVWSSKFETYLLDQEFEQNEVKEKQEEFKTFEHSNVEYPEGFFSGL